MALGYRILLVWAAASAVIAWFYQLSGSEVVEFDAQKIRLNGETTEVVTHRKGKAKKHPGRQTLPPHLPRVEQIIACPTEQCRCGVCGQEKLIIGYEESEQLEVEPAKYFVQVTKREKRACGCGRGGVVTAPAAQRIIEKGVVSDRVVIQTLVNKYGSHLPLYRQSKTLEQETGLELSRATMDGWVMQVGQMLMPVVGAMKKELLGGSYLQADETPVDVQMHDRRGHNHQAYLWQYSRPGERWCSTFVWDEVERGRSSSLGNMGEFCKRMAMWATRKWVDRDWSMRDAGRIADGVLLMW